MSSDVVIRVENVGKKYRLRHQRPERYTAMRDVIANSLRAPWQSLAAKLRKLVSPIGANGHSSTGPWSPLDVPDCAPDAAGLSQDQSSNLAVRQPAHEDFWALNDVSFEVKRGEAVGII